MMVLAEVVAMRHQRSGLKRLSLENEKDAPHMVGK
jgi:hypothetical protein